MTVKCILFDLDGTLLDTNRLIIESWKHTHRTLLGIEKDEMEITSSFGEPLMITLKREFPGINTEESAKVYREFQSGRFEEILDIFPGVEEMIKELRNENYLLGIVTSRLRGSTHRGLAKYDLERYFDCIITADDCARHKPDPEPIERALKILGITPKEAIFVGDSVFDIGCAKNAGVRSIYVAWSITNMDFDAGMKPDYTAHSAQDIIKIIKETK